MPQATIAGHFAIPFNQFISSSVLLIAGDVSLNLNQLYTSMSMSSTSVTFPLVSVPWAWTQREGCVHSKMDHLNMKASITHVLPQQPLQGVNSRAAGAIVRSKSTKE